MQKGHTERKTLKHILCRVKYSVTKNDVSLGVLLLVDLVCLGWMSYILGGFDMSWVEVLHLGLMCYILGGCVTSCVELVCPGWMSYALGGCVIYI